MRNMLGVHVNWTKPFFTRNQGDYFLHDFEILTLILSALKWREKNGKIKLYTDNVGYDFYKKLDLLNLWDGGIECNLDEIVDKEINAYNLWAAAKIYVLREEKEPFVMFDTDLIVWKPIHQYLEKSDAVAIHGEILHFAYPPKDSFVMNHKYVFDPSWSWEEKPINTCFLYIENKELKNEYVEKSIDFMNNAKIPPGDANYNYITYMVFAEQRLLSIIAKKQNIKIKKIFDFVDILSPNIFQDLFTHVWTYKEQIKHFQHLRDDFCRRCVLRIQKEYPDYIRILQKTNLFNRYF